VAVTVAVTRPLILFARVPFVRSSLRLEFALGSDLLHVYCAFGLEALPVHGGGRERKREKEREWGGREGGQVSGRGMAYLPATRPIPRLSRTHANRQADSIRHMYECHMCTPCICRCTSHFHTHLC